MNISSPFIRTRTYVTTLDQHYSKMDAREKCYDTQFKVLSTGDFTLPPMLQASIDKIVKKEGYISHKIFNRAISTSGGNFLAELYEVDIKGETAEGAKETNIFIKNKMEDSTMTMLNVEECYSIENFFYGQLSKMYNDMQETANIPAEERYAMVKSYDSTNPDAIILENLDKKGFSTVHRMDVVPLRFAQLAVQQLARFHGLSWALEKLYPDYYAKKIRNLTTTMKFDDSFQSFIENMGGYTEKCLDDNDKLKLKEFRTRAVQVMKKHYTDKAGVRCCLCHGDYRANNILMKKEGDHVTEVIPVDYQLLYYGCPVMDFIYFIFPCTDQDFRENHLDDLKDLYYSSLEKFLGYFDMDVEKVYPRHEFEAQYRKRLDFGLIMSLAITPILFTDDNDVPDITKEDMGTLSVTPDPKMDDRIRGLVADFVKWGIL